MTQQILSKHQYDSKWVGRKLLSYNNVLASSTFNFLKDKHQVVGTATVAVYELMITDREAVFKM